MKIVIVKEDDLCLGKSNVHGKEKKVVKRKVCACMKELK